MASLKQSTVRNRVFKMISAADHISPKTGLTPTVNLSKNAAAFGAAAGAVSEIGNGWYSVALTTVDTGTLGDLAFYVTGSGADDTDWRDEITARLSDDLAFPATTGRSMVVDANGLVDANAVKIGPTGAGTAQTARDIGASVLLSTGVGAGQLDFTAGVVKANVTQLLGTAWLAPGTAGTPDVNVKLWNALTTVALPLVPTVAGRTLDCSAGGEAGLDWANIGSPTTVVALSGTTIAVTQKVDIDTIKTNPVVNGGTITFPTTATLASTTNLTAGTITTATNVTTVNGLAAAVITAASIAAAALNGKGDWNIGKTGYALSSAGVQAIWDALTTALTTVGSIGKKLADWTVGTIDTYTGNTKQTGDAFARLGAPAGASVSADVAAVKTDTAAIKTKTDSLTFTVAGQADANVQYVNDVLITGNGQAGTEWGP